MRKEEKKVVPGNEGLSKAVDTVLRTEAGRKLWVYLFHDCGYNRSMTRVSRVTGDFAPVAMEIASAQRDVYVRLRTLAAPELLAVAETLAEAPIQKEEEKKNA